uniref:Uncharacterized protein n=1 Tax=Heterorhabditis bacteriophora TaxID=37862 RepID=A0A1I7XNN7_HETBA
MNSISRAVTSRFNDISHKRQRLVGESAKDSEISKIITTPILEKYKKQKSPSERSPNKHISKKRCKMEKIKKSFKSKDRQQLIDSDEE